MGRPSEIYKRLEDNKRRFCSDLGMSNEEVKAVQKAGTSTLDISISTTVAEGTIKNAYKDLYPHAAKIIPEWYAKERDYKNLSSPKA